MSGWLQVLLGVATGLGALSVIWTKALRPLLRFVAAAEEMVPVLRDLTEALHGDPEVFSVLGEIAAEFRTDSGSSLRDVVNELAAAAGESDRVARLLAVNVESIKDLAAGDRHEVARLAVLLGQLLGRATLSDAGILRIEETQESVAADLADAQQRADATTGEPGAAADAGLRSGEGDPPA